MKPLLFGALLGGAVFGSTACGGIAVFDDGVGGNASTTGSPTSTTTTTTKSATASTRASSAVQNSANTMSSGSPDIRPTIIAVDLYASCFPVSQPDPIVGAVTIQYDNVGTEGGFLDIVSAQIGFSNPMEAWVFQLAFAPTSSGFVDAGFTSVIEHGKVPTGANASLACDMCDQAGTVTINFDDGSSASAEATLICVV